MATKEPPIVSQWYRMLDRDDQFQVTAVDEDEGIIEIQHADGDFEELDRDVWKDLDIEASEAPEGWDEGLDEEEEWGAELDEEEWSELDEEDEGKDEGYDDEDEDYR